MLIAAVSDVVWQAIIGAVVTIVLAWMQFRTKQAVEQTGKDAATKVEEVKATLEESTAKADAKTDAIADVTDKIHTLTNHAMEIVLDDLATSKRHIATLTGKKEDMEAAREAENALNIHKGKQAEVDTLPT